MPKTRNEPCRMGGCATPRTGYVASDGLSPKGIRGAAHDTHLCHTPIGCPTITSRVIVAWLFAGRQRQGGAGPGARTPKPGTVPASCEISYIQRNQPSGQVLDRSPNGRIGDAYGGVA